MSEPWRGRVTIGAGALAGGVCGLVVGLLDGVRAAVLVGTSALVGTMLLTAAIDGGLGVVAGAAVELVARVAAWGRRVRAPLAARLVAYTLVGAGAAGVSFAMAIATAVSAQPVSGGGPHRAGRARGGAGGGGPGARGGAGGRVRSGAVAGAPAARRPLGCCGRCCWRWRAGS